jgi:hypothetical protein
MLRDNNRRFSRAIDKNRAALFEGGRPKHPASDLIFAVEARKEAG